MLQISVESFGKALILAGIADKARVVLNGVGSEGMHILKKRVRCSCSAHKCFWNLSLRKIDAVDAQRRSPYVMNCIQSSDLTKITISKGGNAYSGPAEISPAEISITEISIAEISPTEVSVTEISPTEISAIESSVVKPCLTEISIAEIGIAEASPIEISTTESSIVQSGTVEAGTAEVGIAKVSIAEVSTIEICVVKIRITKISTVEVGPAEISIIKIDRYLRIPLSPCIPFCNAMKKAIKLYGICHHTLLQLNKLLPSSKRTRSLEIQLVRCTPTQKGGMQ
jgi:hypothetical protein